MSRKPSKNNSKTTVTTQRRLEALRLRADGLNFEQIGAKLGISTSAAWQLVDGAMKDYSEAVKEEADDLRRITLLQLDRLIVTHLPLASNGDDKSATVVLKTLAERSKLMGLYAPQKTELTGKDGGPLQSVQAQATMDLSALSVEQLAALEEILKQAQTKAEGTT